MPCLRCRIEGRVQGVFFRQSTQEQAEALGIRGHALNLDDGSVEVLACGEVDQLQELREWLDEGPPMAVVRRVDCEKVAPDSIPEGFHTG